jgi:hydrogenase maturation protease
VTRASLVIGVGNSDRGDDGAGLEVVRRLRARRPWGTVVRESSGEIVGLLEAWSGYRRVILIDAASSRGGRPGRVHRFEAHRSPLPALTFSTSGHSLGVAEALEIARTLGSLPESVIVYAIEGETFSLGAPLSTPVRQAVGRVERRVLRDIGAWVLPQVLEETTP